MTKEQITKKYKDLQYKDKLFRLRYDKEREEHIHKIKELRSVLSTLDIHSITWLTIEKQIMIMEEQIMLYDKIMYSVEL